MTGSDLGPERLLPGLRTQRLGRSYVFLDECRSTNDEAAARATSGAEEGLLIAADRQSEGRGRRGRAWYSPAGANLYFSVLLRPALAARLATPLTLLAGAALAQALRTLGFSPRLKWPNDVLMEGTQGLRKVAGILAEMASEGDRVRHVVLGVGINVNSRELPAELLEVATSLCLQRGTWVDRAQVLAEFLNLFEPRYDDFVALGPAACLAEWQRFAVLGQSCWVKSGSHVIAGVADGIDPSGALLMRTNDGALVPVHAGEINWQRPR